MLMMKFSCGAELWLDLCVCVCVCSHIYREENPCDDKLANFMGLIIGMISFGGTLYLALLGRCLENLLVCLISSYVVFSWILA